MDKLNLQGKNIALIAPDMFDYPSEISSTLKSYGANVSYFRDCPKSLTDRAIKNINASLEQKVRNSFLGGILSKLRNWHPDIIFIIKATELTEAFLCQLREEFPEVEILMYQWDINEKYPYLHLVDHVDKCFVFDESDVVLHEKLRYLPLFFRDSYKLLRDNHDCQDIDLLHIGTFHEGKAEQIKEIDRLLKFDGIKVYWYLWIDFFRWVRRMFKGKFYFNVKFLHLNSHQIMELYKRSRAILDLPQTKQRGITMRSFEVLGAYKKLVTTNPTIMSEKLYFKDLVYVLGYDERSLNSFLEQKVILTQEMKDIIEKYSIHSWIFTILGNKQK